MKNVNNVLMIILGTLIGAGFASGKEVYLFFGKYDKLGLLGIVFSALFIIYIIYKVLKIIKKENIDNYFELLEKINNNHSKTNRLMQEIVDSFLLVSFFIMVAAFSAYLKQLWKIPIYISSGIFVLLCYIVFSKDLQGVLKINSILVPFILVFIVLLGIKSIKNTNIEIISERKWNFLISCILYTSYNSIILIPILACMKQHIKTKKDIILISTLSGIFIILFALIIFFMLQSQINLTKNFEMPILELVKPIGKKYVYVYSFIIIASIFTSAISTGFSFLKSTSKTKKEYNQNLILMCILSIFVSKIGFSKLVQCLYPFFGILGILQILLLCKMYLKK